jgi:hypothetical protein
MANNCLKPLPLHVAVAVFTTVPVGRSKLFDVLGLSSVSFPVPEMNPTEVMVTVTLDRAMAFDPSDAGEVQVWTRAEF